IIPGNPEALRKLPGVGRYIAGAVLSFAFNRPAPIVEANSQRVLARLLAWDRRLDSGGSNARLWQAAERLVPPRQAGLVNQALMELGATVCTVRPPKCLVCPLTEGCRARALGTQDTLPLKRPRPAPSEVAEACALVVREGRLLIVQRDESSLWQGFWEFPTIH